MKAGELLLLPSALLAMLLLGLNDHWLKQAYPSWWTGKLSDLAGLYFFPLFLVGSWQLLRGCLATPKQLAVACLSTLLLFSAIKLSVRAGDLYACFVGTFWGTMRSGHWVHARAPHAVDPTDLLALPALAVSYLRGRAALARSSVNR